MSTPWRDPAAADPEQLHIALFYEGDEEYLDAIMRFIQPGLAAGDPVAAALRPGRGRLLADRLNGSAEQVRILDMGEVGRNPARIIPSVEEMLAESDGGRLYYIGEPIWAGRSPEEICEAIKHEALINLAWPTATVSALCPYDVGALTDEVLADAERTHPHVLRSGTIERSPSYSGPAVPQRCDEPLPTPPATARSTRFGADDLCRLRTLVAEVAQDAGLSGDRVADVMLVGSELGTNAIRHGRGVGTLHSWSQSGHVVCQVQDGGYIADPLVGRRRPGPPASGGFGLWMVNQLCDLVEVRTSANGTTVRAHVATG